MDIHVREKCADCGGGAIIQHPAWEQFWEKHAPHEKITDADLADWFTQQGYPTSHLRPHRDLPPEEIPCPSCKGLGYIEEWVPVKQVLEMLLAKE